MKRCLAISLNTRSTDNPAQSTSTNNFSKILEEGFQNCVSSGVEAIAAVSVNWS